MAVSTNDKLLTLGSFGAGLTAFAGKCDERFAKAADVAVYSVEKLATAESGFAASYKLTKKVGSADAEQVGATINIPKDFLVKSAELKTATAPIEGTDIVAGDKYIDFVVNTVDASETATHIYLKVTDLVDVYTNGNGLNLNNGEFSVKIDTANSNGLSVGADGVALATVVASENGAGGSNGAMTAAQAEKLAGLGNYTEGNGITITEREIAAKVDSTNANGLANGTSGLSIALATDEANGAMSATDKTKLDGFVVGTDQEVQDIIDGIWSE